MANRTTQDMDPDEMPTLPAYTPRIREEIAPRPAPEFIPTLDPRAIAPEPDWDPARSRTTTERLPLSWLGAVLVIIMIHLAAGCGPEVYTLDNPDVEPEIATLVACFDSCDVVAATCGEDIEACEDGCLDDAVTDACRPLLTEWYVCMAAAPADLNCAATPAIAKSCHEPMRRYQRCAYGGGS